MTTPYVDFTYYDETFLGVVIAEADFARLALRASAVIDRLTFQRAAAVIEADEDADDVDAIQMATCAVAEVYQSVEADGGADAIQSERVGNVSVTYADNATKRQTADQKYRDAAATYLGSTSLMFPGFAAGEYSGTSENE